MLSHTLDTVTGIKGDYPPEVRITFIPLVAVQLKPHLRDHIALIPLVKSLDKAFLYFKWTSRPFLLMAKLCPILLW